MDFFWVLIIGAGIYFLFKGNTNRGIETVRASIFLEGMRAHATVAEANYAASSDVINLPTEIIKDAMDHVRIEYGGKQLPMIADAYSQGMIPKLPFLYRLVAGLRTDSLPMHHGVSTQEGVSPEMVNEAISGLDSVFRPIFHCIRVCARTFGRVTYQSARIDTCPAFEPNPAILASSQFATLSPACAWTGPSARRSGASCCRGGIRPTG